MSTQAQVFTSPEVALAEASVKFQARFDAYIDECNIMFAYHNALHSVSPGTYEPDFELKKHILERIAKLKQ